MHEITTHAISAFVANAKSFEKGTGGSPKTDGGGLGGGPPDIFVFKELLPVAGYRMDVKSWFLIELRENFVLFCKISIN
jgi:hypothetical protein